MSVLIDYSSGAFAANQAQGVGTITGSTLDISSGTYFNYTPSANTTFTFSNAPASGTAAGFALAVTGANVGTGYDIANASYDSVSFGLSTQETGMFGLFFKPDGTKMYTVGETNDNVYEYDLSTAWTVSSATYSQSFSISSQEDKPRDLFFKPDGSKMYVIGTVSDSVNEYDLSIAWDISTASFLQSASVSARDARPNKMWFKPDGTQFYHLGNTSDDLYEYTLSSAWDVSSLSYVRSFNTGATDSAASSVFFKPDGLTVFITGSSNDKIFEFSLSTAWNISTMSLVRNFSLSSQDSAPESTRFKDDGSKMYVLGATTDTVYQYTTQSTATATFSYPASVEWPSGTAPNGPAIGETDVLVFLTDDNGVSYQGFQAGDAMSVPSAGSSSPAFIEANELGTATQTITAFPQRHLSTTNSGLQDYTYATDFSTSSGDTGTIFELGGSTYGLNISLYNNLIEVQGSSTTNATGDFSSHMGETGTLYVSADYQNKIDVYWYSSNTMTLIVSTPTSGDYVGTDDTGVADRGGSYVYGTNRNSFSGTITEWRNWSNTYFDFSPFV